MNSAAPALCLNVDQATDASLAMALLTEQHAFEVVVMDTVAGTGAAAGAHNFLHLVE
ncbi:hypothetical protein [Specibacter sp. NPDC078692]|uniref:hypothetical protein n=1 Tax=Specibacter sp. NPDC078692 TaxID=3155818 RepID=UPI00341E6ACF